MILKENKTLDRVVQDNIEKYSNAQKLLVYFIV